MPNQRLILMRGLPGSGKSTRALQMIKEEPGRYFRVNRDIIRDMLGVTSFSRSAEKMVAKTRDALIVTGLSLGKDIIVDDTNLDHDRKLCHFKDIVAKEMLVPEVYDFEVIDLTDVPVSECILRDARRGDRAVGKKVIWNMYNQYLIPKRPAHNPDLATAIICDIDGTIAQMVGRSPYEEDRVGEDNPKKEVISILEQYKNTPNAIILVSGRHEDCRVATENWCRSHNVPYDLLLMRPTGDNRSDAIIKREIYDIYIKDKYNVLFVLDDRDRVVDVWRSLGLTCLQVGYGSF